VRLFVAVDVPDELKAAIESDVVDPLRAELPGPRWTRPESRHLTLAFLGEVAEERVDAIADAVRNAAASRACFEAAFETIGGFPNLRRPRVLWIGLGTGAEPTAGLATSVQEGLVPLGFEPEHRPFRSHLTLARCNPPRPLGELPSVAVPAERFPVRHAVLFRSQLHPKGARYTALERFPLA
jgi:2'-5' RNA ligase